MYVALPVYVHTCITSDTIQKHTNIHADVYMINTHAFNYTCTCTCTCTYTCMYTPLEYFHLYRYQVD